MPLWVQPKEDRASGNATLVQKGARWLPRDMPALPKLWEMGAGGDAALEEAGFPPTRSEPVHAPAENAATYTKASSAGIEDGAAGTPPAGDAVAKTEADISSSEAETEFYSLFLRSFRELTHDGPMNAKEISARLGLKKAQVEAWLRRGTTSGQIKKLSKPARYYSVSEEQRQASLFHNVW